MKDIIRPEWIERWDTIRRATDATTLAATDDFNKVAMGGLFLPKVVEFGGMISLILESSYQKVDSSSESKMKKAIDAGLAVALDGATGEISTKIQKAMDQSATESQGKRTSTTELTTITQLSTLT